ncbi:MAG: polyprenyl synthetase family protein, partial [Candidatus Aenigmatarchaeota archaeon]
LEKGDIIGFMEKNKPEIDRIINHYLPEKIDSEWMDFVFGKPRYEYSIEAAQKALVDPIRDLLERGGKRWRPVLFLLTACAVGGDYKKIKEIVVIPEIIHNGTLMIDDIEDMGELRRGRPCTHKIFGEDIAINAGNFMYYFPLIALMKNRDRFSPEILAKAYELYALEMIKLSLGQATDIFWHRGNADRIEEREYLQMCAYKTGCLARMSAKLAAILSGCGGEITENIGRVAEAIGVAFQIQDDILDITLSKEDRKSFGKPFGNDIKEGKRTLMVIRTLEKATEKDRSRLLEILDRHTDDLEERAEAIGIIEKYGAIDYSKERARQIVRDAWVETDELLEESPAKDKLKEFVNYLIERKV